MKPIPSALDRRDFLKLSGSAVVGTLGTACSKSASETPSSVEFDPEGWIDAHVHVWSPDLERWPLGKGFTVDRMKPPSFTVDELLAECRPDGVSRVVLIQMSFYRDDHAYLLHAMENWPGLFAGVGLIEPESEGAVPQLRALQERGVTGFRIRATGESVGRWPDSEGMRKFWEIGAADGLSMCCLTDADALPGLHRMCSQFPETPVVIDHCARIGTSGTIEQSDIDNLLRLAEFDTVHVKTSAFYALGKKEAPYTDLGPMIRQLRDAFGAQRLMWATDCPYQVQKGHTYGDSIALIRDRLDFLSDEEKQWMLRDTAEKVFFGATTV